jgi:hypothetical protein
MTEVTRIHRVEVSLKKNFLRRQSFFRTRDDVALVDAFQRFALKFDVQTGITAKLTDEFGGR